MTDISGTVAVAAIIFAAFTLPLLIGSGLLELYGSITESMRNHRERRSSMTPQTRYYM